jgi:DNA-binding CsgD family transcriptional regulator/tetratricopeptide (TPR) repeat protein
MRSLFGRVPEIALIDAALGQLSDGYGTALHIVGEPGIGKSALLKAVQRRSDDRRYINRTAAADNGDQRRPLALVAQLLPDVPKTMTGDPVSAALASIDRIAGSGPPILLADDVHWADAASLDVLAAIARRAGEIGVLLVTTARTHPLSIDLGRFEAAIDRAGRRVALEALTPTDIHDLVEATMGARPASPLIRLLSDASGNPFLTVELLRALEHDGTLYVEGGSLQMLPGASLPPRLSDRLAREAIIAAGNDSLLIRAAAVIPGGFRAEELATILTRPVAGVIGDLLHLSDAKVLRERNGRLAFRHDIIRQAVVDATPTPVVRALNRRAITVLNAANADRARIASCLLVAADPAHDDDLAALIDLGMSLREQNPFATIDLLSTGLGALAADDPRHGDVALALGWALLDLGRFSEVLALLDEQFDEQTAVRLDVQLLRGQALSLCGNRPAAVQPVPPSFDIASSFPTIDARAVTAVAELSILQVLSGHVQCAERLVEWVESSGVEMEPDGVAYLSDTKALLHGRNGCFEAALAAAQRGMVMAVEHPSSATWRARPTLTAAMMLDAIGRGDEALRVLRTAQNEPGPRWNIPLMQFGAAISLYRRGEWDDALAEIAAGLAATDELGMRLATSWPFALNIIIHTARGDIGTARGWLERARKAVNANALGIEWMMYAAAMVEEAAGAPQAAAKILRGVVDAALSLDAPAVVMNLSPDAVRLAVATSDDETVRKVVDNLAGLASKTESPVVRAFHDWVSGWRLCDFVPAERAAASMAACGRGAEAARAHHDAAVLAATAGSTDDARRLATVAFAGYEQLRAEQLHARLRSELRACGVSMRPRRVPPRPASGWEGLTPTERQVVDLVADGLTNGEIAEQLFVSRRTVESHLSRVYPKLGFHRRAELVVAARQRGDEEAVISHPFA